MGTSQREADAAADHFLLKIARKNALQSLAEKELRLDETPVTIYPQPIRAKAWVRFGAIPMHVDCWIHCATSDAAGVAFTIRDKTFRCWVWGNDAALLPARDGRFPFAQARGVGSRGGLIDRGAGYRYGRA